MLVALTINDGVGVVVPPSGAVVTEVIPAKEEGMAVKFWCTRVATSDAFMMTRCPSRMPE